jgi:hypothetical protein
VATIVDLGHNVNENTPPISAKPVVTSTQLASSSLCAEDDIEGDVENVYDETRTFMASGSGYGTKSLYERRKETKYNNPYDDDAEYNTHDLYEDQMAFCDAGDSKIHGRKK